MTAIPSFEEWRDYCFTHRSENRAQRDRTQIEPRKRPFIALPAATIAEYLCRLFDDAANLAVRYTPDQLADGTWFVFGIDSEYFKDTREAAVPIDLQVRVFRAMPRMYTDLYDKLCAPCGTIGKDLSNTDKLEGAVYMIWDMDCVEGAVMFPDENPHLVDPGFDVLQTVLGRCQAGACLTGALHGLGHLQTYHPERVQAMIDRFLADRGDRLPRWLVDYAEGAREGLVQ